MGLLGLVSKTAKWTLDQVKNELHDYNIKQLVNQAYSDTPAVRTLARYKLKTKHPEVFSMLEAVVTE